MMIYCEVRAYARAGSNSGDAMLERPRGHGSRRGSCGANTGKAAALALAAVLVAAAVAAVPAGGCSSGSISVNGREISRGDFRREVDRRLVLIRLKNPKELLGERGETLGRETERQVATEMIKAELMEQEGRELGIYENAVKEAKRRLEEERAGLGEEGFERLLAGQRLTGEGYLERFLEKVLVEKLGEAVSADVRVNEDEAESFYLTHKELYSASTLIRAAHIVVETEGQARMAAEQISRGEDFARLAQAVSQDVATRNNGGDMGWVEKGTLDPAFEQAAFGLATGQVSGVVRASDGFHVIKVLERRDAYTLPFEQVKDRAMADLLNLKREERFSDWLRTAYANARVELGGGPGVWDPGLGMVVEARGR